MLVVDSGADPWLIRHEGACYYCFVVRDEAVFVRRAESVEGIAEGETVEIWRPTDGLQTLWAPELHSLDGRWYVYVAADDGDDAHHRMYVLGADDPMGPYELIGKIATPSDRWAIDGTVFELRGRRYFVWSGWPEDRNTREQRLYIAEMDTPWSLVGERVCIAMPTLPWETRMMPVNEGPAVLRRGDDTVLVFAASNSLTDDYCLGRIDLVGTDPLDPASWVKHPAPLLATHEGRYGPGHPSFVFDDDHHGWMAYHTARHSGSGWDRQVRVAPAVWHPDGTLVVHTPPIPQQRRP